MDSRDGARTQMYDWEQRVRDAEQWLLQARQASREAIQNRDALLARRHGMPEAVRLPIPEAYIVGSLGEAIDRARERPHATFVTLEGDVVRGPLVIGGKTEGGTPGVFSIKRELADLEAALGSEESRASGIAI